MAQTALAGNIAAKQQDTPHKKFGMIEVASNNDLDQQERERIQQETDAKQSQPLIINLAAYIWKCWEASRQAKQPIETRMLTSLRQRAGEYDSNKLSQIREFGGSEIYMMLTDEKCSAAEDAIDDILFQSGEDPWGAEPTPVPELPPETLESIKQQVVTEAQQTIMLGLGIPDMQDMVERAQFLHDDEQEQIRQRAKGDHAAVEDKLRDVLTEAKWREALRECLWDLCTYPNAFVEGPVVRKEDVLEWTPDGAVVRTKTITKFERVSPWDVYPSPNSRKIGDSYLFIKRRLSATELERYRGVDGFDETAIKRVMDLYRNNGLREWLWLANESARAELESRWHEEYDPEGTIDALQFIGRIKGLHLLQYGMDPEKVADPFATYPCEVWMIGGIVIMCRLNGDPLGRPPLHTASIRRRNGSFWGTALPEVIADIQDVANATARNLVNNMGVASGPQMGVDTDRLPQGDDGRSIYPWKVWRFNMDHGSETTRPPVWFFQPNPMTDELLKVYEFASAEADNKTGFPRYSYSEPPKGGALGTASGFSMALTQASKGAKKVVANVDMGIIEPSVVMTHQFMLVNDTDPIWRLSDIRLVARGSSTLIAKEQQAVRRNEFLQIALNPVVQQIIGPEGTAGVLRPIVEGLDLEHEEIVPTKEEMQKKALMMQMQQAMTGMIQQGMPGQGPQTLPDGQMAGGGDASVM
jgi:hypothetical protein